MIKSVRPVIESAFGESGLTAWNSRLANSDYDTPAQHAAVFLYGLAAHLAFLAEHPAPRAVTGHSLGIYAAAVAAGVLSARDAIRLVLVAGAAIERAQQADGWRLLAVTGLTDVQLRGVLDRDDGRSEVRITHYNSGVQHLVSAGAETLREVGRRCEEAGALSANLLPFPGAVHRPELAAVAGDFFTLIGETGFCKPTTRFYSPVSGKPVETADEARVTLRDQLIRPVRFYPTIQRMAADGIRDFVVLGPCRQLVGIIGWIHRDAAVTIFPTGSTEVRR